jgi:SAM-dependent methyltransferase
LLVYFFYAEGANVTKKPPIKLHPSNEDQAEDWDGDEGTYWAENSTRFDRAISGHYKRLMAAADYEWNDRVLDIGCGNGQTTRDAARAAKDGSALGVDLSSQMLELARGTAAREGLTNVRFEQADAQIHDFGPEEFDIAISRLGVMFFGEPESAFSNIARAVRRGGRLAMLVWQAPEHNEWIRELRGALSAGHMAPPPPPDGPGPFSLARPERIQTLLGGAGFTDVGVDGGHAPMWFGDTAAETHAFVIEFMGWMMEDLDDDERGKAIDDLTATISKHDTGDGVYFDSATWVVTAKR